MPELLIDFINQRLDTIGDLIIEPGNESFLLKFQRVFDKCEEGNQNQRNQLRHMAKLKIAKRVSTALINLVGVVPRVGLEHCCRSRKGNRSI